MTSLVFLDLVGTTIESDGTVERTVVAAAQAVSGVEEPLLIARLGALGHLRGGAKRELLRALLAGEDARLDEAVECMQGLLIDAIENGALAEVRGTTDVLRHLKDRGWAVCLGTGLPPSVRGRIIDARGWTELVDLAVSPEDGGRGRPHPDMIRHAAAALGVSDPVAVVVVGDTVNDLIAGTRAGAGMVVGVLTGAHRREQLEEAPHTHLLDAITGLPGLLEGTTRTGGGRES